MKKHAQPYLYATVICALLAFLFSVLVMTVDVAPIGPENTRIGLSHLNAFVRDAIGLHLFWYTLTEYLGYAALLVAAAFAACGLVQMIRRKSFFKVDYEIRMLGVIYAIVIAMYVFFEFVIINYRPVVLSAEEGIEASFPSSHTMMACVIFGCAIPVLARVSAIRKFHVILDVLCVFLMCVMVVGRLLSGVHWISDIVAALIISATLIFLYLFLLQFR